MLLMSKQRLLRKKKMVTELYERSFIAEPVEEIMIPTVEVPNIWADPAAVRVEKTRENSKRKKREPKEDEKKFRI